MDPIRYIPWRLCVSLHLRLVTYQPAFSERNAEYGANVMVSVLVSPCPISDTSDVRSMFARRVFICGCLCVVSDGFLSSLTIKVSKGNWLLVSAIAIATVADMSTS